MNKILLVEDKDSFRKMLYQTLVSEGYDVSEAKDGDSAIQLAEGAKFDAVITDFKLIGTDGIEVLKRIKEYDKTVVVIIMTAFGTIDIAVEAMKGGAYDFIQKPFDPDDLLRILARGLEQRQLEIEKNAPKDESNKVEDIPKIIGKSDKILYAINLLDKVATSDATVLILGESGTGKELFARTLHYKSNRKNAMFITINCAAIPNELLESELFGYEKGAYTGAYRRKIGKFEMADKGTIFLDEIGDLDLSLQAKLLRVLQYHQFERVGGNKPISVDIRVVAATNKDLISEIREKKFREDLYYRLSVFPIHIPPLRERKEDIPILVEHFVNKFCKEANKPIKKVNEKAMKKLMDYEWRGNVRELENCIERAVILSDKKFYIGPEHIDNINVEFEPEEKPSTKNLLQAGNIAAKTAEKELIQKVLNETKGNKSKAARILEVSYKTLLEKIKEYKLNES